MQLFINLLVNGLAVFAAAYLLPGVNVANFWVAILVAIVLGLVNTFIKPILVVLTLPVNVLTLGLFTFVINALLVLLVSNIVPGFTIESFWWALLFSIIVSLISTFLFSLV